MFLNPLSGSPQRLVRPDGVKLRAILKNRGALLSEGLRPITMPTSDREGMGEQIPDVM